MNVIESGHLLAFIDTLTYNDDKSDLPEEHQPITSYVPVPLRETCCGLPPPLS
jgi:hypothetical protein